MKTVIETHINHKNNKVQNRMIEINNWSDYVREIKEQKVIDRMGMDTHKCLCGVSLPKYAKIKKIYSDKKVLICYFTLWNGESMTLTSWLM